MFKYISCIVIMLPLYVIAGSTEDKPATSTTYTPYPVTLNGVERTESADRISYRKGGECFAFNKTDGSYVHLGIEKAPLPKRKFAALKKLHEGK